MAHLHDFGEEYIQKQAFNTGDLSVTSCELGLYLNDPAEGGDDLGQADNVDAITTEPSDGNYTRTSVDLTSSEVTIHLSGPNAVIDLGTRSFTVENSTGDVDSWFIVINYQSDEAGNAGAADNLILSGRLDVTDPEPIDSLNALEVTGIGGELE